MAFTEQQIDEALARRSKSKEKTSPSLSESEIDRELQKRSNISKPKKDQGIAQGLLGGLAGSGSFLSGVQKGATGALSGAEKLGAKGLDYILGTKLSQKVKQPQQSQFQKALGKAYPAQSGLGEFVGESIPGFVAPVGELKAIAGGVEKLPAALRGAARFAGRVAKGAPTGAALAAIQSPDDQAGAAKFGAAIGAASPVAEKALSATYGLGKKGLQKLVSEIGGGTNTVAEIGKNVEALENIGLHKDMPLGNVVNSPALKGAASFIGTIPGSKVAKNEIKVGKSIQNSIGNQLDSLAPAKGQNVSDNVVKHLRDEKVKQEAINKLNYENFEKLADNSNTALKTSGLNAAKEKAFKNIDENNGLVAFRKLKNDKEVRGLLEKIENITSKRAYTPTSYVITQNMVPNRFKRDLLNKMYREGGPKIRTQLEREFETLKQKPPKRLVLSFKRAADLKQEINQVLGDTKEDERSKRSLLRSLKKGLMQDVQQSADESGDQNVVAALKKADLHHIKNVVPLREKGISKFISGEERAEKIIPHFLKDGSAFEQPELLKSMTKNMSQQNKDNLAHAYLTRKARTILDKDTLDEDKILDSYNKLGDNVKRILFKPSDRKIFDSAHIAREMTGKSLKGMINPSPKEAWARIKKAAPFVTIAALGGAPMAGGSMVLANALTKGIKNERTRNIYIKSLKSALEKGMKPKNINLSKLTNISIPELTRMLQGNQGNGER